MFVNRKYIERSYKFERRNERERLLNNHQKGDM